MIADRKSWVRNVLILQGRGENSKTRLADTIKKIAVNERMPGLDQSRRRK